MSHFLQSSAWAEFNTRLGTTTLHETGLLYLERTFTAGSYFLSSRCKILNSYSLPPFSTKPSFIRFEPEDNISLKNLETFARSHSLRLEPTLAVQPRQTILVPLGSDDEVLQSMKQKHRYNTRLSLKNTLDYLVSSTYDENVFERFWSLLSHTAHRQGFRTHPKEYYKTMVEILSKNDMAHIILISKAGNDLAAMLLITYEDTAVYLHGASNEEHRSLMAPFFMHYTAMQFARDKGCTTYDLWGSDLIRNTTTQSWEPKEGHSSAGTSRFKLGFGGQVIEYPGTFDLILQPFCYTLYKTARALKGSKRSFH